MNQYPGVTITQGQTANSQISAYPDTQCVVVYNESPYFLQVTLVGSGVYSLAAYTADCFQVFSGFTGNIVFMPTQYIALGGGTAPASITFVQAYGDNEPLTKLIKSNQATGYPISLNRLQNIGNSLPVGTQATNIVNNGATPNTSIVSVQPSDASSPTITIDNEGNVLINGNNAGTLTQLLKLIAGASPEVLLATSGVPTEIVGYVGIQTTPNVNDALLIRPSAAAQQLLLLIAAASQTANIVSIQDSAFNHLIDISGAGNLILNKELNITPQASISVVNNQTINTHGITAQLASPNLANVTGIVLQTGDTNGQLFLLINTTAFSMTMSASGNVAVGASIVVNPLSCGVFIWSTPGSLWYKVS